MNLGNNRWFVKPDIGISKAWGPLTVEVSTGVTFFSKNDDYFRKSQKFSPQQEMGTP